jgi:hypothetical protein
MTTTMMIRSYLLLALGFSSVTFAGCGDGRPARVPVSGNVTIDGKPVTRGSISFRPVQGRLSGGQLDEHGRFSLTTFEPGDGCVPGSHRVTVHSTDQINRSTLRWNVPKKYKDKSTSDIEVSIDGPTDDLEIKLTWDGQQGPILEKIEESE